MPGFRELLAVASCEAAKGVRVHHAQHSADVAFGVWCDEPNGPAVMTQVIGFAAGNV